MRIYFCIKENTTNIIAISDVIHFNSIQKEKKDTQIK